MTASSLRGPHRVVQVKTLLLKVETLARSLDGRDRAAIAAACERLARVLRGTDGASGPGVRGATFGGYDTQ